MSGLFGQPFDQFGVLILADTVTDPDSTITDPVIYRKGAIAYYRSTAGVVYPLIPGADGGGVKVITQAMSPYVVLDTDQLLLCDTTAGTISLTLPSAGGPTVGRQLTVIDVARNFGTNTCTLNGNGNNVNGFGSQNLKSGETIYWSGAAWETNIAQLFAANSITGPALQASGFLRYLISLGRNGAGAVTLTGAKVGDAVIGVCNVTDVTNDAAKFEATITVADQIQQSSATDLSAKTMTYLILARS